MTEKNNVIDFRSKRKQLVSNEDGIYTLKQLSPDVIFQCKSGVVTLEVDPKIGYETAVLFIRIGEDAYEAFDCCGEERIEVFKEGKLFTGLELHEELMIGRLCAYDAKNL